MAFGRQLKAIREYRNIPQKELADFLKIEVETLSRFEHGKMTKPGFEIIEKLREKFEVSADYFHGDDSPEMQYALESVAPSLKHLVYLPTFKRNMYQNELEKDYWERKKLNERTALQKKYSTSRLIDLGVDPDLITSLRK